MSSHVFLACVVVALLAISSWSAAQDREDTLAEQRILVLVNQERSHAGVPPVTLDPRLTAAARKHCQRMIQADSLVHQLPGEDPLLLRLVAEGVRSDHDGENIALNGDIASAHAALMQSPGHRANVLGAQFNAVGIAVMVTGELLYVTEDFARVLPDFSDFEADAAAQQAINDYVRSLRLPLPVRRARTQLTRMACDLARDDRLDPTHTRDIPGVTGGIAWTATDLSKLPSGLTKALSTPLGSGYSLGVCFAPSPTYPGGVYWLLFVTY
jgi:hypothetical protein